jgi:hypothetical protein
LARNADGTLAWRLQDYWGWVIEGVAVKDGDGYRMEGGLGPTPPGLGLEGEDEMRNLLPQTVDKDVIPPP